MSLANEEPLVEVALAPRWAQAWDWIEERLVRVGDRLNPILVKEARQALKSRQFTVTFGLLLLLSWMWTIGGLAIIGPEVSYGTSGPQMFAGYYFILLCAVVVIVPFTAYRSLAAERDDNTYELLMISSLSARQIVGGKLASAVLQIIIYLSATAPCLAFTYLLRGIDIVSIGALTTYVSLSGVGLSIVAIFLATLSQERWLQVIFSLLLILGLILAAGALWAVAMELFLRPWRVGFSADRTFWIVNTILLGHFLCTSTQFFLGAAAGLEFPSENRSTKQRWAMLAHQTFYLSWTLPLFLVAGDFYDGGIGAGVFAGLFWYLMGGMMTSERVDMSPRVKRGLPQSGMARMYLTWLNPGPATGYMFAIVNLAVVALAFMATWLFGITSSNFHFFSKDAALSFLICGWCYVAIYLGLGRLVIGALRKATRINLLGGVLIHLILVAIGTILPLFVQYTFFYAGYGGYSFLQITNPLWTLFELLDHRQGSTNSYVIMVFLAIGTIVVFLMNLPSIVAQMNNVRIALPARVAEEDAALSPPPEPPKLSPWD